MQTRRLFARIWRINAIVILLVGLLAGLVLTAGAYLLFRDATRTRHVDNVANTALGDVRESTAELGTFEAISGSSVMRAPLTVRHGSGYKEAGATRNYLYLTPATRSTHWLRPSMAGVILSSTTLPAADYGRSKPDAVVDVHVIVDHDSNGDNRLTVADTKQLAVSTPDGRDLRVVASHIDRLNKALLIAPRRLLVVYSAGPKLTASEIDLDNPNSPPTSYEIPIAIK